MDISAFLVWTPCFLCTPAILNQVSSQNCQSAKIQNTTSRDMVVKPRLMKIFFYLSLTLYSIVGKKWEPRSLVLSIHLAKIRKKKKILKSLSIIFGKLMIFARTWPKIDFLAPQNFEICSRLFVKILQKIPVYEMKNNLVSSYVCHPRKWRWEVLQNILCTTLRTQLM